ncbi:MAG: hypothetical protein JJT77_13395, partial [Crocinitomicaceae bacterium]|nr:hypothetical protein [Crocinitomicaceae bacterium]
MALRIILTFSILLATSISLLCQSLSGVINNYYQIININSPIEIEVDDASGLNTCENVLIIQMRGADIDQSNTSSFGSITDYANSGNYEFSTIQSVNGNILTLTSPLVRQYSVSGFVQLVTFPQFNNASIDGQLSCQPWDGVKGGVLALRTTGKLSVNADIDVKGKGFRGGDLLSNNNWGCPPSSPDYFYAIGTYNHAAPKGEGISIIPPNISFGRGAAANGGG